MVNEEKVAQTIGTRKTRGGTSLRIRESKPTEKKERKRGARGRGVLNDSQGAE